MATIVARCNKFAIEFCLVTKTDCNYTDNREHQLDTKYS